MKKSARKPLKIVSLLLLILGIVGVILTLAVPGKTYSGTQTVLGQKVETRIVLDGTHYYRSVKTNGEWVDGMKISYKIKGGKFYVAGAEDSTTKINGLKMVDSTTGYDLTCKLAMTFFVVSCVFAVVGLTGTVVLALTDTKKKKRK